MDLRLDLVTAVPDPESVHVHPVPTGRPVPDRGPAPVPGGVEAVAVAALVGLAGRVSAVPLREAALPLALDVRLVELPLGIHGQEVLVGPVWDDLEAEVVGVV